MQVNNIHFEFGLRKFYYWSILIAITLLLCVMYYIHPYVMDDMAFPNALTVYWENPSVETFLTSWREFAESRYLYDNGRLAQMFAPAFLLLPRWIVAIVWSVVVMGCMVLCAKMSSVWMRHPLLFGVMVFLWIFIMPWADYMFVRLFAANYILSGFMVLLTLWLWITGRLKIWSAFLLGFVAGAGHEMYCAALIGVVCVEIVAFEKYRSHVSVTLLISLLLAFSYLFFAPSRSIRADDAQFLYGFLHPGVSAYLGFLFYLFIVLFIAACISRKWRSNIEWSFVTICLTGSFVGWVVWRCFFLSGQRTAWCMDIFSLIGIVYLVSQLPLRIVGQRSAYLVGLTLAVMCVSHLCACIPWFVKMNEEVSEYNAASIDENGRVYVDLTLSTQVPSYLLGKPNFNAYNNKWTSLDKAIPASLKNYDFETGKNIGLTFPVYEIKGYIATPYDDRIKPDMFEIVLNFDGLQTSIGGDARRFKGRDGKDYLYIVPYYVPLRAKDRKLTSVELIVNK